MQTLKEKIAVITGGANGIGKAIVQRFQAEGATVIVFDVQPPDDPVAFYHVDMRSDAALAAAAGHLDRVDNLVTSAGVYARVKVEQTPVDVLHEVVDVNLKGTYLACKHLLPLLVASRGCIIHIASGLALAPEPESPAYCASKAGVVMLTKCMAQAYAADGLRVNAVLPGPIDTAMLRASLTSPAELAAYAEANPMRRIGMVEEVANVAWFLASDQARCVTGGLYAVDGGESTSSIYSR